MNMKNNVDKRNVRINFRLLLKENKQVYSTEK